MTHDIYQVTLNTTQLGGITRCSIPPGIQVRAETNAGNVSPAFASIVSGRPMVAFTTQHIKAALTAAGVSGYELTGAGLLLYGYAHDDGGTRAGASLHRKYTITKGLLVPRRLTCRDRGDAELSYECIIAYDGSNDPIQVADSQSVPTAESDAARFAMGAVAIGGVTLGSKISVDIDFGIDARGEYADSDVYPTKTSIFTISPRITIRGIDPTWFAAAKVPLAGLSGTHANTSIVFRARAAGGTFSATSGDHLTLTAAGLVTVNEALAGGAPAETEVVMQCKYDGTNTPIKISA